MGTTIHYAVPRYPMLMGNIRIPDDPFMGFVQQAEQLAQEVLNNLEFPHRIHRIDRRDSQDKSGPQLVYGFEIEFEGPGKGCENLRFGWEQDQDCPTAWVGAHYCKTCYAKAANKTHRAVVKVIQAWDEAKLIQNGSVLDEANLYRRRNNKPKPPPNAQQLSMELEAATPTPTPENPPRPEQEDPPTPNKRKGMKLILEEHKKKLKANWPRGGKEPPVVKIFNPTGTATWLIHSMDPNDEDTMFGLCDPGLGFPELGYVSLSELQGGRPNIRIIIDGRTLEMPIFLERDKYFQPTHSLQVYAEAARAENHITERSNHLDRAALKQPPLQQVAARSQPNPQPPSETPATLNAKKPPPGLWMGNDDAVTVRSMRP